MGKDFYDVVFMIPYVSRVFDDIRDFVKKARTYYRQDELVEIQLYNWIGSNTLGVLFRFNIGKFVPRLLKWFDPWVKKLQMQIVEIEKFGQKDKESFLDKFRITSDVKFTGQFDLDRALDQIALRFKELRKIRSEVRINRRIQVRFKTEDAFAREYTKNISYGGMFLKGVTNLPLGTRIEVELVLPGSNEAVRAEAEVVHVVTKEEASLLNGDRVPGCGLRFVRFYEEGEEKLGKYLKKLAR